MRFFSICLSIFFVTSLKADFDNGLAAYQRGDFGTAYYEWLAVAESAPESIPPAVMAESSYALGMLYWVGQGVAQDSATSARWLLQAAELGHPGAQTKLGYLYVSGLGVHRNDFAALKWTQMAANQGDVDAQYNLAVFYRDGQGVAQNKELALKWFREAASNGDKMSADVLANYEKFGWPIISKVATETEDPVKLPAGDGLDNLADAMSQTGDTEVLPAGHEPAGVNAVLERAGGNNAGTGSQPAPGVSINDVSWINQRDPQHFTIQVIALLSPIKLQEFVDQNSEWGPFAIYQQRWKGRPLFVLLQGDYVDVELARAAAARFPLGLQNREELWIRKFIMVQRLLQDE